MITYYIPWEPKTFISRGYDPYIGGFTTFIFHGFGVQRYGMVYILGFQDYVILIKTIQIENGMAYYIYVRVIHPCDQMIYNVDLHR